MTLTQEAPLIRPPAEASYGTFGPPRDESVSGVEEPESAVIKSDEDEVENPDRPRGLKFAVLLLCILIGDFLTGYVSLQLLVQDHN